MQFEWVGGMIVFLINGRIYSALNSSLCTAIDQQKKDTTLGGWYLTRVEIPKRFQSLSTLSQARTPQLISWPMLLLERCPF